MYYSAFDTTASSAAVSDRRRGRAPRRAWLALNRIVGRDDVKAVDLPALRRHIGLAGIDEVVELLRVEIGMLRVGVQVGLDDQDHAKRMREEPALMRDVRALGVGMLNRHGADLSWPRNMPDRDPFDHGEKNSSRSPIQTRWPRGLRAWTQQPWAADPAPRPRARSRA